MFTHRARLIRIITTIIISVKLQQCMMIGMFDGEKSYKKYSTITHLSSLTKSLNYTNVLL